MTSLFSAAVYKNVFTLITYLLQLLHVNVLARPVGRETFAS